MKLKALVAGLALAAIAGSAMAATTNPAAPVVGAAAAATGTSGTEDVTLTIADIVHISGLSTIALGTYAGDSLPMTASDAFCVYRNGTGNYSMTLTSPNASGTQLRLKSGTNYINYSLDYTDAAGTVTNIGNVAAAATRTAGGVASNATCSAHASDNGAMAANVAAVDLDAAQPGSYLDTLTLTIKAL